VPAHAFGQAFAINDGYFHTTEDGWLAVLPGDEALSRPG